MRIARAFLWEFQRRHHLGLAALAVYLVGFAAIKIFVLGPGYQLKLDPPNGLAAFVFVPATFALFYFVGVFSYGLSGDLAARQSIYPSRLFTLPVTSAALAGWPMLYGVASAAMLFLLFAGFMRLCGVTFALPLVWPSLLMGVYMAWMQAFMWMPYGLAGARVIIAVLALFAIDAVVITAFTVKASNLTMIALLTPQLPLAFVVAWIAVSRARRGDTPDWHRVFAGLPDAVGLLIRRRRAFKSRAAAQAWFERRTHGRSLPLAVALVLPFELWLLFIPNNNRAPTIIATLIVVLLTPPFFAVFIAAKAQAPSAFTLVRPVTSAALIAAKLRATIWSTLAAWLIVAIAVPVALVWSGSWNPLVDLARRISGFTGAFYFGVFTTLAIGALVFSTWKKLVQSLCISLSGRPWLIKGTLFFALALLVLVFPAVNALIGSTSAQAAIWNALPWLLIAATVIKFAAGSWAATRLNRDRLLPERAIVTAAITWLVAVIGLYGLLAWLLPDAMTPSYLKAAIAVFLVPLGRIAAAPLALSRSRHQ